MELSEVLHLHISMIFCYITSRLCYWDFINGLCLYEESNVTSGLSFDVTYGLCFECWAD